MADLVATRNALREQAQAPFSWWTLLVPLAFAAMTVGIPLATLEHPQIERIVNIVIGILVLGPVLAVWFHRLALAQARRALEKAEGSLVAERQRRAREQRRDREMRELRDALGARPRRIAVSRPAPLEGEVEAEEIAEEEAESGADVLRARNS